MCRSQHSPKVWFQPVSSPQQTGELQNVQLLHGLFLPACAVHLSQHSCAEVVRCPTPKVSVLPPRSEWGSSPHVSLVVTPGQSAMQFFMSSAPLQSPSPQQCLV